MDEEQQAGDPPVTEAAGDPAGESAGEPTTDAPVTSEPEASGETPADPPGA